MNLEPIYSRDVLPRALLRLIPILIAWGLMSACTVRASLVVVTNFSTRSPGSARPIVMSTGSQLIADQTGTISVGYFPSDYTLTAPAIFTPSKIAEILGKFIPLTGSGSMGGGSVSTDTSRTRSGLFKTTFTTSIADPSAPEIGRPLYLFIGNGTSLAASTGFVVAKLGAYPAFLTPDVVFDLSTLSSSDILVGQFTSPQVWYPSGSLPSLNGHSLPAIRMGPTLADLETAYYLTWASAYFPSLSDPNVDSTADPDHDGSSNQDEYLAGTHPLNATSVFRIRQSAWTTGATGNCLCITWDSVPGKTYTVIGGALPTSRSVLVSPVVADGSIASANVPSTSDRLFYRVMVGP